MGDFFFKMIPTHKKVLSEIFGLHSGLGEYMVEASSFDKQQLNQNLFPITKKKIERKKLRSNALYFYVIWK